MRARRAKRWGVVAARAHLVNCCRWAVVNVIILVPTLPGRQDPPGVLSWIAPSIGRWHTGQVPAPRRRPDTSWLPTVVPTLQALLEAGEATRGLRVTVRGGQLLIGRTDEHGADPRFRLTPLGAGAYGLSLYRRQRWEPLPYEGTLEELADTMNEDLAAWADAWS